MPAEQTTDQLAATTSAGRVDEFYWDTVVFKVENSLFKVPRERFIAQSEVFSGMFQLVPGDGHESVEGGSDDNPIVLEGYKADDFIALLKALYPGTSEVNGAGGPRTKDEMISALKLSTIWEMKKIRKYAVYSLSHSFVSGILSPVEKITLAREHRVSKWFIQGLTSLVEDNLKLSLDELEASVGLRTAYRILGIKHEHCSSCRKNVKIPVRGAVFQKSIRDAFEVEINEMVEDERRYDSEVGYDSASQVGSDSEVEYTDASS
ncbi:hypothetical protein D9611_006151 [Ephemerocybe angulata]|uniref:BTB domain-containing protein n=1 Tax=Ephemerocybe angulata TaxID=980116 RepID=A0A8H5FLC7_9AGAR|nr:hypothetical protein D9611_006151 [Tulosesus angulatus]